MNQNKQMNSAIAWELCNTPNIVHIYQGYIQGHFLGGGGNLHICLYVCMYTRSHGIVQACILVCVFNDIKSHTHAYSMHIKVSFRITMKMLQWQIIVM